MRPRCDPECNFTGKAWMCDPLAPAQSKHCFSSPYLDHFSSDSCLKTDEKTTPAERSPQNDVLVDFLSFWAFHLEAFSAHLASSLVLGSPHSTTLVPKVAQFSPGSPKCCPKNNKMLPKGPKMTPEGTKTAPPDTKLLPNISGKMS